MLRLLLALLCLVCCGPVLAQKAAAPPDRLDDVIAALPAAERPTARMVLVRGSSVGRRVIRGAMSAAGRIPPVKGKPATQWKEADLLAKLKGHLGASGWKTFSEFLKAQPRAEHALLVKMLGIRIDLPRDS